jgi:DNA-binding NarL/FixJ family response regulator
MSMDPGETSEGSDGHGEDRNSPDPPEAPRLNRAFVAMRQPAVGEALALALDRETDIECLGSASTIEDTIASIATGGPEVLLIGASLLGHQAAVDAIRGVVAAHRIRIVILAQDAGPPTRMVAPITEATVVPPEAGLARLLEFIRGSEPDAVVAAAPQSLSEVVQQIRGQVRSQRDMIRTTRERLDAQKEPANDALKPSLTKRELDVVLMLQMGQDVSAISRQLGLSLNTVRGHVKQILWKTGAHSQLEAIAICVRAGVLRGQLADK